MIPAISGQFERASPTRLASSEVRDSSPISLKMAPGMKKRKSEYKSDDFVASDGDDRPVKRGKGGKSTFEASGKAEVDDNGDTFWQLTKNRRVTVSEFKKNVFINIREYYDDNGTMKPGKKVCFRLPLLLTGAHPGHRESVYPSNNIMPFSRCCLRLRANCRRRATRCRDLSTALQQTTRLLPRTIRTMKTRRKLTNQRRATSKRRATRTKTKTKCWQLSPAVPDSKMAFVTGYHQGHIPPRA